MLKRVQRRIVGFIFFVIAAILLIFMIKNNWDINAAVNSILSLFGK